MKKKYFKIITASIFIALIFTFLGGFLVNNQTQTALAQEDGAFVPITGIDKIQDAGNNDNLEEMIALFFSYSIGAAVALSVLVIIYGAVLYMTTDAFSQKSEGKEKIVSALGGLILALISWLILETINPDLVRIDFGVDPVAPASQESGTVAEEVADEVQRSTGNIGTTTLPDGSVIYNGTGEHYIRREEDGELEPLGDEYDAREAIRAASTGGRWDPESSRSDDTSNTTSPLQYTGAYNERMNEDQERNPGMEAVNRAMFGD